jgi:hypothetical protein
MPAGYPARFVPMLLNPRMWLWSAVTVQSNQRKTFVDQLLHPAQAFEDAQQGGARDI